MAIGAYPGTFNPPTVAHLAIAEAACQQGALERVDWVFSTVSLGKEQVQLPLLQDRVAVLEAVAARHAWLGVVVTGAQLLADIAEGYDALVLGADKWAQIQDPAWYGGSPRARDEALARLPRLLVAPRPPIELPAPLPPGTQLLQLASVHAEVSSRGVRAGRWEWMLPEAVDFDRDCGAWSDPERYCRQRMSPSG